jgi:hypothetical protein
MLSWMRTAGMTKPMSAARNSSRRCLSWKISRVPWVASPNDTIRASPISLRSGLRSLRSRPASALASGIAFFLIQSMEGASS